MSEHGEMIQEYVTAVHVHSVLDASGLAENEAKKALAVIQHDRAQWVVDNIAIELGQRASALTTKIAGLDTERQQALQDLEVIDQTLGHKARSSARVSELMGLYDKQLSYESETRIMQGQSPFILRMKYSERNRGLGIEGSPSLTRWVIDSESQITELSEKRFYNTLLNAARTIDREALVGTFDSPEFERKVYFEDNDQGVDMVVADPCLFFDTLRGNSNGFGHKSMIAIMYLIEFQSKA